MVWRNKGSQPAAVWPRMGSYISKRIFAGHRRVEWWSNGEKIERAAEDGAV